MSISAFTDKNHLPTEEEIRAAVSPRLEEWDKLIQYIRETYAPEEDWKFLYGKKYGWALRFRIKGKLFTSLYPAESGFAVQIILSQPDVEKALKMNPGENVRTAIEKATPYEEGRWLFITIESDSGIRDVQSLLSIKSGRKH